MTEGTSSCRPARLLRFEETLDAVADGLARRRGALADALEAYRAGCSSDYRVPTADTVGVIRGFGGGLRDFGHWVGDVGRAFEDAAVARAFTGTGSTDMEGVIHLDDDFLLGYLRDHLDPGEDPYRGIPEGMASSWADRLGLDYDQTEPPAWVEHLAHGGTAADFFGPLLEGTADALTRLPEWAALTVRVEGGFLVVGGNRALAAAFSAEVHARLRLPTGYAPHLATAARWVNRTGLGLAFAAGAGEQWYADASLPTPRRVARATTRGVALAGGGLVGGAVTGLACGPAAPVCSTVAGIAGAFGGAFAGDKLADLMPWMEPNDPAPAEHNLDDLSNAVAGLDGQVETSVAATVDLMASDVVLATSAHDPAFQSRVATLLPSRERLEFAMATGERPEDVTPTGTTTTTTSTTVLVPPTAQPPSGTAPDPWVERRTYE